MSGACDVGGDGALPTTDPPVAADDSGPLPDINFMHGVALGAGIVVAAIVVVVVLVLVVRSPLKTMLTSIAVSVATTVAVLVGLVAAGFATINTDIIAGLASSWVLEKPPRW